MNRDFLELFFIMIWSSICIYCLLRNCVMLATIIMFVGYFILFVICIYDNYKRSKQWN